MVGKPTVLIALTAALAGCAEIRLNWAMERVNAVYVDVFYNIECGRPEDLRASVRGLVDALDAAAIAGYSRDPDYQRLLDETRQTASMLYVEARSEEIDPLLSLRSRLSANCQACHDEFRR